MTKKMTPFKIHIPQSQLDDLKVRLESTLWPNEIEPANWRHAPTAAYVQGLVNRWRTSFTWRTHEARLNHLPQFC